VGGRHIGGRAIDEASAQLSVPDERSPLAPQFQTAAAGSRAQAAIMPRDWAAHLLPRLPPFRATAMHEVESPTSMPATPDIAASYTGMEKRRLLLSKL